MTNTPGGIEQVGANVSLKCQSLQSGHPAAYYTWPENAGGRPNGDLLIFDKLTREHNGRNVTCAAKNEFTVNRQPVPKATLTLHVHGKSICIIYIADFSYRIVNDFLVSAKLSVLLWT